MTVKETQALLTLLQTEYPQSFSKLDIDQKKSKVRLWADEFAKDDGKLVYEATRILMRNNIEFAPNIGQIRTKLTELKNLNELTETQAWAMVSKACKNGLYGYKEEFAKLPPEVQAAVGSPEMIKQWANMNEEDVESVIASNFMRSYRTHVKRERERALIAPEVMDLIAGMTKNMGIGDGEHDD